MFRTSSKIWLINISMAGIVVFLGIMSYEAWTKNDDAMPEVRPVKNSGTAQPIKRMLEKAILPEAAYGVVAEKNLFFSTRTEAIPKELEKGPPKISEKMIYLYGVMVLGDKKQALISNPETGPEADKKRAKDKWVKIGDTLGNFSVAEIDKTKVILTEGDNRHEILLYDPKKPARKIIAQPTAAPTLVAAGAPAPTMKPPGAGTSAPVPSSTSAPAAAASGETGAAGEFKIINTPFGPVKRRIK
jgi:hypothetical protein